MVSVSRKLTDSLSSKLADAVPLGSAKIAGNPSSPTRTRWHLNGVLNAAGERVKLEAWKVGGRLYTTPLAVDKFLAALNCENVAEETPNDVERRGREAGQALEALGY